jgi:SH3/ankyrin repeat-containing protein
VEAPPIPDPDYSLSESDGEEDSVRLASQPAPPPKKEEEKPETSGSSTGSSCVPHSFSVDEIQKIQTKLKASKSYPDDFRGPGEKQEGQEGDSSSSGVSSDQEVTITMTLTNHVEMKNGIQENVGAKVQVKVQEESAKRVTIVQTQNTATTNIPEVADDDQSPSPPLMGFQRHNSLTRKQAATIAANRAKQIQMQQRHAVTLAQLPPPIEMEADEVDCGGFGMEPIGELFTDFFLGFCS